MLPEIEKLKKVVKGKVIGEFLLSKVTSFGVGGPADIFVLPEDEEDVLEIIEFSRERKLPLTFIGRGTNLLIRDGGVKGIVVSLKDGLNHIEMTKECVNVGAGVPLPYLAKFLMDRGISGFEFAWGIPGTVGGAVIMNAGAFGGSISDFLQEVVTLTYEGRRKTYKKKDLKFSYRKSAFQKRREIVVSVKFCFERRDDPDKIFNRMKEIEVIRKKTQPIGAKTAGSIFRNPKGDYAGRLIEKVGLKGARIGGAIVSRVHANFIENTGNARARDIEELILYIEKVVKERTGIELSREVEILGYKD